MQNDRPGAGRAASSDAAPLSFTTTVAAPTVTRDVATFARRIERAIEAGRRRAAIRAPRMRH